MSGGGFGAAGEFDEEVGAGFAGEGEMTAEGFDAPTHAAQATALARGGVLAVVFDGEAVTAFGADEAEAALGGPGVANDVCDGLAEGKGEDGFFGGGEGCGLEVAFGVESDAGGEEGLAGGFDLGTEAAGAVAADGFADLREGDAGGAFDVGDLGAGTLQGGEVRGSVCGGPKYRGLSAPAFGLRSR